MRRCPAKAFLKSIVETSERRKAGGPRHGHHRHAGLHNQFARKIEPVVVRDLLGRLADFFFEKPAQMSCAHAQSFGELLFVRTMKGVAGDEFERSLNDRFFSLPGG